MTQGYPERDGGAEEEGQGWGDSRRLITSITSMSRVELSCILLHIFWTLFETADPPVPHQFWTWTNSPLFFLQKIKTTYGASLKKSAGSIWALELWGLALYLRANLSKSVKSRFWQHKPSWQALTPSLTKANANSNFNFHCISAPNHPGKVSDPP